MERRKTLNEELGRKSVDEFKKADKIPVTLVLDNVRSLKNVGSVFRTADAFLVESIYLCGYTGTPPNKDIQKTALGATESVSCVYVSTTLEAVKTLQQLGYMVYAVEQAASAILLNHFEPPKEKKMAFIFGNEVKGVDQEVVDACNGVIEIPQSGTKHSLNIAVSAGIVVWHLYAKYK